MPDAYCANCREPWGQWHLRNEVIYAADGAATVPDPAAPGGARPMTHDDCRRWDGVLTDSIRAALGADGWEFGRTTGHVRRCPACDENLAAAPAAALNPAQAGLIEEAHRLMPEDPDAVNAELEDLGFFG